MTRVLIGMLLILGSCAISYHLGYIKIDQVLLWAGVFIGIVLVASAFDISSAGGSR